MSDEFRPASFRPATDREWVEGLTVEGDHPMVAHIQRLRSIALDAMDRLDEFQSYGRWHHNRFTDELQRDPEGDEIFWRPPPSAP